MRFTRAAREARSTLLPASIVRTGFPALPGRSTGSGFIVNADGTILTNNHVVRGSSQLTVKLSDMKSYKAKVLGTDSRNDLALIRIDAGRKLPNGAAGRFRRAVVGRRYWPSAIHSA